MEKKLTINTNHVMSGASARADERMMRKESKLYRNNLFSYQLSLFERVHSIEVLQTAFKAVRSNGGAPGIDGISVEDFESRLPQELSRLEMELKSWTYNPSPVRRVEIRKPGGAEARRPTSRRPHETMTKTTKTTTKSPNLMERSIINFRLSRIP
jgi:retron-type reverse transcriptase